MRKLTGLAVFCTLGMGSSMIRSSAFKLSSLQPEG